MDQYAHDDEPAVTPSAVSASLQAQVMPHWIELAWDNKTLRVPNPEHVRQLAHTCVQQAMEIQHMKERQITMQNHIQQLQRMVQQLQNHLGM